mmetsp:Transcript_36422/g.65115  ORF Transcript_36422/g.65115 Transcript_36422/m.65115 type:complete len:82 (-) Transcript_36422:335-580(-)
MNRVAPNYCADSTWTWFGTYGPVCESCGEDHPSLLPSCTYTSEAVIKPSSHTSGSGCLMPSDEGARTLVHSREERHAFCQF